MKQNNYGGALQKRTNSGFTATSTTTDVIKNIDLTGKTIVITGGNTGIGLETTKTLASAGATVIVAARNIDKAKKNLAGIDNVELVQLDIMDPVSIDHFAADFLASGRVLDILINNAGIMWVPLRRDARGVESQLATNYLGHFQLTARLWPALRGAHGARVINVSSLGHHLSSFNFDDPNFDTRPYETLQAYGQSKTATNLFAVELDNRAKEFGVRAYSLHPGSIHGTELGRDASLELFQQMGFVDAEGNILPEVLANLKTIPQGAATTVWAATSVVLDNIGGVYCEDVEIAELTDTNGKNGRSGVQAYSLDEKAAKRLWDWSEAVTGISFKLN